MSAFKSGPTRALAAAAVLDDSDFQQLRDDMTAHDSRRETIIKQSRDIGKLAKQAIFSLHRGNDAEAQERLDKAAAAAEELLPVIAEDVDLRHGAFSAALEEYAEARLYQAYLKEGRLLRTSEIALANRDEYLGGVLDFTGELNRFAVARATERDTPAVEACRTMAETIMGEFLQFDLRNGALRKKFDVLKYTLRKLEVLLYELSLAKSGTQTHADEMTGSPRHAPVPSSPTS